MFDPSYHMIVIRQSVGQLRELLSPMTITEERLHKIRHAVTQIRNSCDEINHWIMVELDQIDKNRANDK